MFLSSELDNRSFSPTAIIRTVTIHDQDRFTTPITKQFLQSHLFRLQIDSGANHSVTNYRDCLHRSWDINPYIIGGIGDSITCTAKKITSFALTAPSFQSPCFSQRRILKLSYPLTDTVFTNNNSFDS